MQYSLFPHLRLHAGGNVWVVVIDGSHDVKADFYGQRLAEVGPLSNGLQLLQQLYHHGAICTFLSTHNDDFIQLLNHSIQSDLLVFGKQLRFLLRKEKIKTIRI